MDFKTRLREEPGPREVLGEQPIPNGVTVEGETSVSETNTGEIRIHTPEEIAEKVGRITIKTLKALIRARGLETTTLGHAPPSKKGGPPRRLWGMTDAQLECLVALRKRSDQKLDPASNSRMGLP